MISNVSESNDIYKIVLKTFSRYRNKLKGQDSNKGFNVSILFDI